MGRLLLVGCGGHARSLIDIIESTGNWQIVGLIGKATELGQKVLGYPIIGTDSDLDTLRRNADHAVLALGHFGSVTKRRYLESWLEKAGFSFPTIISSHAIVSRHTVIGPGTTIGHGAIVNAGASIGNHCIINSRALLEHDVKIGNHCHISTGALINGGVELGNDSFIGSGALIRESIVLPSATIVSAGKRIMGWPVRDT